MNRKYTKEDYLVTRTAIPDWDLDDKNRPRKGWVEINSAGEPQVVLSEHFF